MSSFVMQSDAVRWGYNFKLLKSRMKLLYISNEPSAYEMSLSFNVPIAINR